MELLHDSEADRKRFYFTCGALIEEDTPNIMDIYTHARREKADRHYYSPRRGHVIFFAWMRWKIPEEERTGDQCSTRGFKSFVDETWANMTPEERYPFHEIARYEKAVIKEPFATKNSGQTNFKKHISARESQTLSVESSVPTTPGPVPDTSTASVESARLDLLHSGPHTFLPDWDVDSSVRYKSSMRSSTLTPDDHSTLALAKEAAHSTSTPEAQIPSVLSSVLLETGVAPDVSTAQQLARLDVPNSDPQTLPIDWDFDFMWSSSSVGSWAPMMHSGIVFNGKKAGDSSSALAAEMLSVQSPMPPTGLTPDTSMASAALLSTRLEQLKSNPQTFLRDWDVDSIWSSSSVGSSAPMFTGYHSGPAFTKDATERSSTTAAEFPSTWSPELSTPSLIPTTSMASGALLSTWPDPMQSDPQTFLRDWDADTMWSGSLLGPSTPMTPDCYSEPEMVPMDKRPSVDQPSGAGPFPFDL